MVRSTGIYQVYKKCGKDINHLDFTYLLASLPCWSTYNPDGDRGSSFIYFGDKSKPAVCVVEPPTLYNRYKNSLFASMSAATAELYSGNPSGGRSLYLYGVL